MHDLRLPAYKISKEDVIRDGGYYDKNGLWNSIYSTEDGKLLRGRVETFVFKESDNGGLEVFLRLYKDNTYRLPGGSMTKGVSNKLQAYLECKEEARLIIKDIEYTGVHYIKLYEEDKIPDKQDPNSITWVGSYNEVFIGFLKSRYNGEIKKLDEDKDMYDHGLFFPVDYVLPFILPEHKPIFDTMIKAGLISESVDSDIHKDAVIAIHNIVSKTYKDQGSFILRFRDVESDDGGWTLADYQFYDDTGYIKFRDYLIDINNCESLKQTGYSIIIPDKSAKSGILFIKPSCSNLDQPVKEETQYDDYQTTDNHQTTSSLSKEPNNPDWMKDVEIAYAKYQQNKSRENRDVLLQLGWNPDSEMTPGQAKKIIARAEAGVLSGNLITVNEEFIFNEYADSINENYIISKADVAHNIHRWSTDQNYNILYVTGLSGSGKTTFANKIAKDNNAEVINLDMFQCYRGLNSKGKKGILIDFIDRYMKYNNILKDVDFSDVTSESFGDYFKEFFDWLIIELHKDKSKKYIVEGIHILLYVPYKDIEGEPLVCIGSSMIKSLVRHWQRDGWTITDIIRHGKLDIELFIEWERQYSKFLDSIGIYESYIEESVIPRIDKRRLSDEEYVKKLIKDIDNTSSEDYNKRSNLILALAAASAISLSSGIGVPLAALLAGITYKISKVETRDSEKKYIVDIIDKSISKLKKSPEYRTDTEKVNKIIKDLEHNKALIMKSGKDKNNNSTSSGLYANGNIKLPGNHYFYSLAGSFYNNDVSVEEVKEYLDEWKPEKDLKNLYFETYIEEIVARGFDQSKIMQYIKIHEGDANYITKDTDNSSIKRRINGKTLTTVIDSGGYCIVYCKEDGCCYLMDLKEDDLMVRLTIGQVIQASKKGYDDLRSIVKTNIKESYIEESASEMNKAMDEALKAFKELGCKDANIDKSSRKKFIEGKEDSVCIAGLGTEKLEANCAKVNKVLKDYNASVRADNYGCAFLRMKKVVKEQLSSKEKSNLPDSVFGLPEKKKYPMPDRKHVFSAIRFFNYVDKEDEKELAENIKKKMKKYKIDSSHVGEDNRLKKYL